MVINKVFNFFIENNFLYYYTVKQKYFILKYFFDSVSKPSKVFFIEKAFVSDNILKVSLNDS